MRRQADDIQPSESYTPGPLLTFCFLMSLRSLEASQRVHMHHYSGFRDQETRIPWTLGPFLNNRYLDPPGICGLGGDGGRSSAKFRAPLDIALEGPRDHLHSRDSRAKSRQLPQRPENSQTTLQDRSFGCSSYNTPIRGLGVFWQPYGSIMGAHVPREFQKVRALV